MFERSILEKRVILGSELKCFKYDHHIASQYKVTPSDHEGQYSVVANEFIYMLSVGVQHKQGLKVGVCTDLNGMQSLCSTPVAGQL